MQQEGATRARSSRNGRKLEAGEWPGREWNLNKTHLKTKTYEGECDGEYARERRRLQANRRDGAPARWFPSKSVRIPPFKVWQFPGKYWQCGTRVGNTRKYITPLQGGTV